MTDCVQVSTATGSREEAVAPARSAVEARLAAGAQVIGPVATVFWHLGNLGEGEEYQVLLRTTADRYAVLERHLVTRHTWENPEVAAVPISQGSPPYLAWVRRTVSETA